MGKEVLRKAKDSCPSFCSLFMRIRQKYSHYGNRNFGSGKVNLLIFKIHTLRFCIGILCADGPIPSYKRKIEMENFEGEMNYSLLHTYLYVSYLDTLNELNNISSNQKDIFLGQLCSKSGYADLLCLNLIMNNESLLSPAI